LPFSLSLSPPVENFAALLFSNSLV